MTVIVTSRAVPAKEVEKDASMVKQKEMMAAHYERLTNAPIEEIAVTNTIALPDAKKFDKLSILSVGGLLAKAIANTHRDKSVSSLFD